MRVQSPSQRLYSTLLSKYMLTGQFCERTLVGRILKSGYSPIEAAADRVKIRRCINLGGLGITDSIRTLIFQDDFNCKGSITHEMVKMIVKVDF